MNKIASVALVVVGVILLASGWNAYQSISSDISRAVTGAPTDRALWLLIAGGFATASGLAGLAGARGKA